jgi:hypothetical protein
MEALVTLLSAELPVPWLIQSTGTILVRVLMHHVEQAHTKSDCSAVWQVAMMRPVPDADAAT